MGWIQTTYEYVDKFFPYLPHRTEGEGRQTKKKNQKKFGIKGDLIHSISWIEILLQTPIEDYRKNAIGLILAPYLINIRKFSYEMASVLIKDWLRKCNQVRTLDFNYEYKVKYCLNTSIRKMQLPLKFDTLKTKNNELYVLLSLIMLRKIK